MLFLFCLFCLAFPMPVVGFRLQTYLVSSLRCMTDKTRIHLGVPFKILRLLDDPPSLHISESFYDC